MSVNVEKIMQEIRDEIKEKGYTYDMLSFKDISVSPCSDKEKASIESAEKDLAYMGNTSFVAAYRPLAGNKLAVLIKKVIRKLTKFYVEPIVASQNEFNNAAVQSVGSVIDLIKQQKPDESSSVSIDEVSERLSTLELQLKTAYSEIRTLNERINQLEAENDHLKKSKAE